jgi:hypothetical protein
MIKKGDFAHCKFIFVRKLEFLWNLDEIYCTVYRIHLYDKLSLFQNLSWEYRMFINNVHRIKWKDILIFGIEIFCFNNTWRKILKRSRHEILDGVVGNYFHDGYQAFWYKILFVLPIMLNNIDLYMFFNYWE